MVGVYCVNFIIVVAPARMMFVYSVHLITVVDTYSVNSIIYRTEACVSHPVLKEDVILQLVLNCTNKMECNTVDPPTFKPQCLHCI